MERHMVETNPIGEQWGGGLRPNTHHHPCSYNHVFDRFVLRFHFVSDLVTTLNHCNSVYINYFVDP